MGLLVVDLEEHTSRSVLGPRAALAELAVAHGIVAVTIEEGEDRHVIVNCNEESSSAVRRPRGAILACGFSVIAAFTLHGLRVFSQ